MAINVNYSTDRVDAPTIVINGQLIDETAGTYSVAANQTITTQDVVIETDVDVRQREVLAFEGDVTITITPDTTWTANSYSNRSSGDIIGKTETAASSKINKYSETYYTVNGKNPIRTKSNLYTGAFEIRANKFGSSDNIIIKARTYCGGQWSEVRKVEIRIVRTTQTNV